MKEFAKKYWWLIGAIGIILGIAGNYIANRITNKQLLDALIAEQSKLLAQSKNARLSTDQQMKLVILQSQINLLKNK